MIACELRQVMQIPGLKNQGEQQVSGERRHAIISKGPDEQDKVFKQ